MQKDFEHHCAQLQIVAHLSSEEDSQLERFWQGDGAECCQTNK